MSAGPSPHRAMAADAVWNYAALAVTALVGAVVTFLIAGRLGTAALGVFAQLYAVHVIGAQVAVFGIHDSTQKHVAEHGGRSMVDDGVVTTALGLVLVSSLVIAVLLVAVAPWVGEWVASRDVGRGLTLTAPGIVAFALNKVLFAALNGRGQLRRYAVMQLVRAALVLVAVLVVIVAGAPVFFVGGIFAAAELLLLPCLFLAVRPAWPHASGASPTPSWWRRHLTFGSRGLVNGILLETHLRVDVVTLGYFVSDRAVGVYAFASLFAEGLYQVPVVMRTVAYPAFVRLASLGDRPGVSGLARRLSVASGVACGATAIVVALAYPVLGGWVDVELVSVGWPVLLILLAGMTVYAFVVPFDQLLLQSGLPGRQSALMATYVFANVVLNITLIPRFGLTGAAVATATALVLAGVLLLVASRVWLGYRPMVLLHKAAS
ncbi:MAG TPA: oligosaccharide flippase family protein [Vicinamibacterales bacterium]|nr:oligosaccharide flippase family protein [Vicinamibacterales bacterium]